MSTLAARGFLAAMNEHGTELEIETLNLWEAALPEFSSTAVAAKYQVMDQQVLSPEEQRAWSEVNAWVNRFKAADVYVFSVPMWNYSIPYKLKQFIDLVTHFGLTFVETEDGLKGLVGGQALVIYARGGDYGGVEGSPDPFDFQSTYMKTWLELVGIDLMEEVAIEETLSANSQANFERAQTRLTQIASSWYSS